MRTAIFIATLHGCSTATVPAEDAPSALERCHVTGVDAETRCGTITVPENRDEPSGRTIDLNIVVVPAVRPDPDPSPLVFLAGGPGQAASRVIGQVLPSFTSVQQQRDLVFVDQRGTGKSNGLDCASAEEDSLAQLFSSAPRIEELRACRDSLTPHADLSRYQTTDAVSDLEHVRAELGYTTLNLYGVSYGTRVALAYATAHPDRVRTMTLDGTVTNEMKLFLTFAADGERALDMLLSDCESDAHCAQTFPQFRAQLTTLLTRSEATEPVEVKHPRTAAPQTLQPTGQDVATAVRGALYQPTLAALLPLAIAQASANDWAPLVAMTSMLNSGLSDGFSEGMMMSVVCQEDWPRITDAERRAHTDSAMFGSEMLGWLDEWCSVWVPDGPSPRLKAETHYDGPVLLLSGDLDPVTPPHWAERARTDLPNAVHLIAPGAGHNVGALGCIPSQVAAFIADAGHDRIDTGCVQNIQRPPFVLDFGGPTR